MKKPIIFVFVFFLVPGILLCYELTLISPVESFSTAQYGLFFINEILTEEGADEYQIKAVEQVSYKNYPLCEVYHLRPRGHIVVPVYKEFPPIKSFSFISDFDTKSKGYEYVVLNELEKAFQFLKESLELENRVEQALDRNRAQWRIIIQLEPQRLKVEKIRLKNTGKEAAAEKGIHRLIIQDKEKEIRILTTEATPLLMTEWNQGDPYWNDCPQWEGSRCYVGCVATAMVQIMRYYRWPPNGEGSHSYYWDKGGRFLSADFSDSYDWNHMPPYTWQYDTLREKNAVSELSYEAGVSVDMDYGTEGSSAYTSDVADALKDHFKYSNSVKVVYRYEYSGVNQWFDVFKKQRDQSRPVEFSIYSEDSGHAVVVDGYLINGTSKKVHINMGWGGYYDAYYTVDNIRDYTDTYWQHAVVDIIPRTSQHYDLSIEAGTGGTTEPPPGTHSYVERTEVTVTAVPHSNYRFGHWSGDESGSSNPVTVVMDSDKSIKAHFIRQYDLTIQAGEGGTTEPSPGTHTYDTGTEVSVEAFPDEHYIFDFWSGCLSSTANPVTVTMNADNTLTAHFQLIQPPLNLSGEKVLNRSLYQAEYINELSWDANPANQGINIAHYRIYEVTGHVRSLVVELSADTFEYMHRDVEKDKQYKYAVAAVTAGGREGQSNFIVID